MNAELPGGSSRDPGDATAEPSADAAVSDQDPQDLTEDEKREVEMAMERRQGYENAQRQNGYRDPQTPGELVQGIIAGITPVNGGVVSALNIATAEERRCARKVAEDPTDQVALEYLRRARAQLERIRVKAGLPSGALPRHRPRREAFRYARERSMGEVPEVTQELRDRFAADLEKHRKGPTT